MPGAGVYDASDVGTGDCAVAVSSDKACFCVNMPGVDVCDASGGGTRDGRLVVSSDKGAVPGVAVSRDPPLELPVEGAQGLLCVNQSVQTSSKVSLSSPVICHLTDTDLPSLPGFHRNVALASFW